MRFSGHFNALVTLSLCVMVQQATGMQVQVMMPKSTSFSTSSSEHRHAHHRLSAAGLQASPLSSPLSLSSSLSLSAVTSNKRSQTFSVLAQHKFDITSESLLLLLLLFLLLVNFAPRTFTCSYFKDKLRCTTM